MHMLKMEIHRGSDQSNQSLTLLGPPQVARELGVSIQTLAVWRCMKRYRLPYVKVGRLIRYRRQDVDAFIASRRNPQEVVEASS